MGDFFLRNQSGGGGAESLENAVVTLASSSFTYDGTEKEQLVSSVVLDGVTLVEGQDYVVIGNKATNAGTHTLTVLGTLNYGGSVSANWSIAKASVAKPTLSSGSFTYNGSTKEPTLSGFDSTSMVKSGDTEKTDAGSYTLTVSLTSTTNYKWSDDTTAPVDFSWSIAKRSFTKPTITSGSFTYAPSTPRTPTTDSNYKSAHMTKGGDTSATNAGNYTLTISLNDTDNNEWADHSTAALSLSWSIAKAQGTISVNPSSLEIQGVNATGTSTITRTGDGSLSVKSSNTSVATVNRSGTTVTVTGKGGGSATITVTLGEGSNYLGASCTISVNVVTAKVFGVVWNYGNSSTALTRLTPSTDPNGYVNVTISSEPSPAVGTGSGSSPFDSYAPWKDMEEYNVVSNAIGAKKGASGFSRTSNDTVVYIPTFYCKIVKDTTNSKIYFYISDNAITGFTLHPGSNCYVGRYHTIDSSGYYSRSGSKPKVSITRSTARTNSHNKGSKWYQWGLAQWNAIQLLYIIEFADWNSQAKIGKGNTETYSTANTGGSDSMTYHTGRASGTDGQVAAQYRGIEELWGNVYDWLDGVNMNGTAIYACTDPSKFADDTATNYTSAGFSLPGSNYITGLGVSAALPWLMLPDTSGGSDSTYIPDYVYSFSSGWRVAYVGGYNYGRSGAGLFQFIGDNVSSSSGSGIGSRLLFIP